jgi:hypothetical protein
MTIQKFQLDKSLPLDIPQYRQCLLLLLSSLKTVMNHNWIENISRITDCVAAGNGSSSQQSENRNDIMYNFIGAKSLMFFNGRGPWGIDDLQIAQLQLSMGLENFSVFKQAIEAQYFQEAMVLVPPTTSLTICDRILMFSMQSCTWLREENLLQNLISFLRDRLSDIHLNIDKERDILILLRNPSQLLTNDNLNNNNGLFRFLSGVHGPVPLMKPVVDSIFATDEKPLRGKHEILHGEYLRSNHNTYGINPPPSCPPELLKRDNFDRFTYEFIVLAMSLAANMKLHSRAKSNDNKFSLDSCQGASIVLVAVDWFGGENFSLLRNFEGIVVEIKCHNLLPTLDTLLTTDIRYDQCKNRNRKFFEIFQASLPIDVELVKLIGNNERKLILNSTGLASLTFEDILAESIEPRHLRSNLIKDDSPAKLIGAPRCYQLSTNFALVGVEATGVGTVQAVLYELPSPLLFAQFQRLLQTSEDRKSLNKLQISSPCSILGKSRFVLFRWNELRANTSYGVWFISTELQFQESIGNACGNNLCCMMFKTHTLTGSHISSIFLTSVLKDDFDGVTTARQRRLLEMHNGYRTGTSHVAGVFCNHEAVISSTSPIIVELGEVSKRYAIMTMKPNIVVRSRFEEEYPTAFSNSEFLPLSDFYRTTNTRSKFLPFPRIGSVQISIHGNFAYIMPSHSTNQCLREIIFCLNLSLWKHNNVKVLVVFTGKLLVHALFRDGNCDRLVSERSSFETKLLVAEFLNSLLTWKFSSIGREVKLLGAANLPSITTVIVSKMQSFATVDEGCDNSVADMSISQASKATSMDELLSFDSSLSKSLANKSKREPLLPLELSHLSSVFVKNGLQFFIFPTFFECTSWKEKQTPDGDESADDMSSRKDASVPKLTKVILPTGVVTLGHDIVYEVVPPHLASFNGMSLTKARTELYSEAIERFEDQEPVIYRIDLLIDDLFSVPLPDPAVDYEASIASNSEFQQGTFVPTTLHGVWMHVQEILSQVDMFKIVTGPLVSKVSTKDVRIIFEFNMQLSEATCILRRSTGVDPDERDLNGLDSTESNSPPKQPLDDSEYKNFHISRKILNVEAYKPIVFYFDELSPDCKYEILLPKLIPFKVLGVVRTIPIIVSNVELLFTGANNFANVPIVNNILDEIGQSQTISVHNMQILNEFVYNLSTRDLLDYDRSPSLWNLLSDNINTPGSTVSLVVHLAPQTILTTFWKAFQPFFLNLANRISIDGDDTIIRGLYIQQLDHSIKDTVVFVLSSPQVARVFGMCGNVPLYDGSYLLPTDPTTDVEFDENSAEYRYTALIRRMFQKHVQQYFVALFGLPEETKDLFHSWRVGSIVVAMLDNVSGRSKLTRNSNSTKQGKIDDSKMNSIQEGNETTIISNADQLEGDEEDIINSEMVENAELIKDSHNPQHIFDLGFIDRGQWKALRSLSLDETIMQLVIVMDRPAISLYGVAESFQSPSKVDKGSVIPWCPTTADLILFLQYWIDWILKQRNKSKGVEIRSLLLVSHFETPFTTIIQDLRTGIKIHQLCVADYSLPIDSREAIIRRTTTEPSPPQSKFKGFLEFPLSFIIVN